MLSFVILGSLLQCWWQWASKGHFVFLFGTFPKGETHPKKVVFIWANTDDDNPYNPSQIRGWAEQEPSICTGTRYPVPVFQIPVPAEPVPDIWQEKSRKICNSLNLFQRVTFTFQIKIYRNKIFLLIFLTVAAGMTVIPVGQRQKQDISYSHKYLVSFLLNPYTFRHQRPPGADHIED